MFNKKSFKITVGTIKNTEVMRTELKKVCQIGSYADSMLDKVKLSKKKKEINLVKVSVSDLGFRMTTTIKEIYDKAQSMGLALCEAEDALYLRLQYQEQPLQERIFIGMKQINDSDGDPHVFRLVRYGDGLWLDSSWADPSLGWGPGLGFVFRKIAFVSVTSECSNCKKYQAKLEGIKTIIGE